MLLYLKAGNKLRHTLIEELREHQRILGAVQAADGTAAGTLMRTHILNSMEGVARFLQ